MDKRHTESEKQVVNIFNEYKDFIKDKHVAFIIKKTERIVYGVYMLSHFVPTQETLHSDLKKTSHKLLAHVSDFVIVSTHTEEVVNHTHALLQHLSSLLTLSFMEGYTSQANIEIMKHEINYLHKHIEELSTRPRTEGGQLQFKADLFVVPQVLKTPRSDLAPKVSFKPKPSKTPRSDLEILGEEDNNIKAKDESIQAREQKVIEVIRTKGIVSIKDISTVISDVSEKTIQRTLQALIDKGQITKEGERRWARYQLC